MMSENRFEALVGAVVLAVALVFLVYLTRDREWFGGEGRYELSARFTSAQGINEGTRIRMAGVPIGQVRGIDLDPETYYALVRMRIEKDVVIPDDSVAGVSTEGILGGQYIEITPGGSPDNLAAGDLMTDTRGYVGLVDLLADFFFTQSK